VPVDATSLEARPLGGTETGLLFVADILAARGHNVSVFTSQKNPISNRVRFINQINKDEAFDVLIAVQDWKGLFYPISATRRYLWTGDGPEQFINFGLGDQRVIDKTEGIFTVSDWQAEILSELSGYPLDKIFTIKNGVDINRFHGEEIRKRNRLIYASSPNRGLALAIELFRELWKKLPHLEFHIFSDFAVYDRQKPFEGPLVEEFKRLQLRAANMPGVFFHGNIPQARLAREFMKSTILFYPNSFVETSCIVALESLAAGTPVVASKTGGLPDTVRKGGILIEGDVGCVAYKEAFLAAVYRLITDVEFWKQCSDAGRKEIVDFYQWSHVADRLLLALGAPKH